jgi:hypothetical protein
VAGALIALGASSTAAFAMPAPEYGAALERQQPYVPVPKHHSEFTVTGDYIDESGRATRDMDRLAIRRDGANVTVDIDALFEETDGAKRADAVVKL